MTDHSDVIVGAEGEACGRRAIRRRLVGPWRPNRDESVGLIAMRHGRVDDSTRVADRAQAKAA